ncbi:MAG: AAA family ATPase [Bacteroidales bacterium]
MGSEAVIYRELCSNLEFEPTQCQERLFKELASFLVAHPSEDLLLVKGYAGTGKTSAIASFVKVLRATSQNFTLLAPTGRAAKVLSTYTNERAYTIHKEIYRERSIEDGVGSFALSFNKKKNSFFIVDEASLIASSQGGDSLFGSGDLLEDLISFVRGGRGNRLILIGDPAQLPPVGEEFSKSLSGTYLSNWGVVREVLLTSVVRQAEDSGILYNATLLRELIESGEKRKISLELDRFNDIERINGADFIEVLESSYQKEGRGENLVICRSNRMAVKYNKAIRSSLFFSEEELSRGDLVMVVKNSYRQADQLEGIDFIANGDVAEVLSVRGGERLYNLQYRDLLLSFPDYDGLELSSKVIVDVLGSESASLGRERERELFFELQKDYLHIRGKANRLKAIREDPYYGALQIKYGYAVTCHKSQGGQWRNIFIDNPFWKEELEVEDLKWLYTAFTRATQKLYLVNFRDFMFR